MFSGVTFAAKGYFDALVRMGELASESHGSKDLGEFIDHSCSAPCSAQDFAKDSSNVHFGDCVKMSDS